MLRPHVLLADEMGLGKTIQVIGYLNETRPRHVLIVCPNNLRLNWLQEIDKWMDPTLRATYEIEQCTPAWFEPTATLVVASFEGLVRWALTLSTCQAWDVLVVDEAHFVKNSSTKRHKALFGLKDVVAKKILLTGTPICNYPYELFPLINFLDQRQWPSRAAFERRYCPYGNKYGYHLGELQQFLREGTTFKSSRTVKRERRLGVGKQDSDSTPPIYTCSNCIQIFDAQTHAEEHVQTKQHEVIVQRIERARLLPIVIQEEQEVDEVYNEQGVGLMIRRLKKEVLPELPRKRRQIIELPAEGELLALVEEENKMWQTQALLVQEMDVALGLREEDAIDTVTNEEIDFQAIIERLKFNRRYFFDEIAIIRHKLALAKVPYVIEHIEDLLENKDKLVVFVHHNDVARAIFDKFADKAVLVYGPTSMEDRADAVERFWKDDKVELFIGSLKTSGLGLNLQVAANVVFAELDWVPGVITQAEDRCHRIGQEKSLLVQHLVASNSMDSHMAKKIVAKQKSIQKALNRQEVST
jgi:SNF2 family DNA or RNA helicase